MPLGREIRKVFIPEEGSVFVDADYSQIELRVLAHMSGDAALIAAYQADEDIHAITASQVFDVPLDQVYPSPESKGGKFWNCLRHQLLWFRTGSRYLQKGSGGLYREIFCNLWQG